jgi:hypothetical protein
MRGRPEESPLTKPCNCRHGAANLTPSMGECERALSLTTVRRKPRSLSYSCGCRPGAQGPVERNPWAPTLVTPEQTLAIGENLSQLRCGIVPPYGKSILTVAHLLWHRCRHDAVMRILMRIRKKQSGQ